MFKFGNKNAPLSEGGKNSAAGRGCGAIFGSVFLFVGLGVAGWGFFWPMTKVALAAGWDEVPCEIISSSVGSHSGSDGATYSIDITYRYQYDGQTYTTDTYGFADVSSSGRDGKQRVVAQYPEGSTRSCYVNPNNPSEAVLNRDFQWFFLVIGGFGGVFALAGFVVVWFALFGGRGDRGKLESTWRDEDAIAASRDAVTLDPGASRAGTLGCVTLFAIIWNGIIAFPIFSGELDGFASLFMIPFVLVGLALIGGVIYLLLALFNPKFTLTLDPGRLYPGESARLTWSSNGAVNRIRQFSIVLEGRESATYRRGTDTVTERETFHEQTLFETQTKQDMAAGDCTIETPIDTMHTFTAPNNKIEWQIKVKGDIARWPDVGDTYPLNIDPFPLDRS